MFGNKKRIESLEKELGYVWNNLVDWHQHQGNGDLTRLWKRIKALEDYLNIEYKEETTKGYVKKENKLKPEYTFVKFTPKGRKSNNKKK